MCIKPCLRFHWFNHPHDFDTNKPCNIFSDILYSDWQKKKNNPNLLARFYTSPLVTSLVFCQVSRKGLLAVCGQKPICPQFPSRAAWQQLCSPTFFPRSCAVQSIETREWWNSEPTLRSTGWAYIHLMNSSKSTFPGLHVSMHHQKKQCIDAHKYTMQHAKAAIGIGVNDSK